MADRGGRGRGRGGRGQGGPPRGQGGPPRGGSQQRGGRGGGGGGGPVQVYRPSDGSRAEPDKRIQNLEDKFQREVNSNESLGLGKLGLGSAFPIRPGYGTRGKPVSLYANYLEFVPPPDLPLYRYAIEITPNISKRKAWQVVNLLLEMPQFAQIRNSTVTDYAATLVTCEKLKVDNQTIPIQFKNEGEDEPTEGAPTYQVKVLFTNQLRIGDLIEAISSTNLSNNYDKSPLLQALNIWLGHHAKRTPGLVSVGSSKAVSLSSDTPRYDLGAGLIAWRGFFSSIRVATSRILVNINVSHRVFWEPVRFDELFAKHKYSCRGLVEVQRAFKNIRVRTTHLPEKKNKQGKVVPRIKTFWSFANKGDGQAGDHPPRVKSFGSGPKDVEFYVDDKPGAKKKKENIKGGKAPAGPATGRYISVAQYFKTTYGLNLDPNLPVINVGNRGNPMYLPMEVCVVLEGQSAGVTLPPSQTQNMIRFAVRKPWENFQSIIDQGTRTVGLRPDQNPQMNTFNFKVPLNFVVVPGRVLSVPSVCYKQNKKIQPRFGSWNMQDIKFSTGATLRNWAVKVIMRTDKTSRIEWRTPDEVGSTVNEFRRTLIASGMTVDPERSIDLVRANGANDPAIEDAFKKAPGKPNETRLLLFIIPDADIPLYRQIKSLGDRRYGVHSAVVVGSKFKSKGVQYYANEALKINMKLGGVNQIIPDLHLIKEDKTIVIGADVTHPSPASGPTAPSVAGMVGSIDCWLGQFLPELRVQTRREEMVLDFGSMFKTMLTRWKTHGKHQNLPENVLVYRDGVSEGQYQKVLEEELPQIQKACKELYPPAMTKANLPRLSILIVGKRHHTRFTVTKPEDADRSHNPTNGTVVDRGITEARMWDFYLQAHTALQGTARPAHYICIHDEIFKSRKLPPGFKNTADLVEDITHQMCYLFGRATKAVSICPPAYYADRLCDRARAYLSQVYDQTPQGSVVSGDGGGTDVNQGDVDVHNNLKNTMYFV